MRRNRTVLVALVALLAVALGYAALGTEDRAPQQPPRPGPTDGGRPARAGEGARAPADTAAPPSTDGDAPAPAGGGYFPLTPVAVMAAATMGSRDSHTLQLTGTGGVPPGGVEAVALSLGVVPSASGRLALAAGEQPPDPTTRAWHSAPAPRPAPS
jgi:hypothetical protein